MKPPEHADALRPPRAARSGAAWLTLLTIFGLGLTVDLASKAWSFRTVAEQPIVLDRAELLAHPDLNPVGWNARRQVLPWDLLDIKLALNPGAVFGIGARHRGFFIVFSVVALTSALVIFGRFTTSRSRAAHIAIGMILAGGLGNLYDRIVFGRVRDFLQVLPRRRLPNDWTWPGTHNTDMFPWVFNIADLMLFLGVVLLLIHLNRDRRSRSPEETAELEAAP